LCKCGRTDNLKRRLEEHGKAYNKEFHAEFEIICHVIIDPTNISQAEMSTFHYFENKKIKYKNEKNSFS
jgi:predicted GIY-YIG superfamily endonuclease